MRRHLSISPPLEWVGGDPNEVGERCAVARDQVGSAGRADVGHGG